MPYNILSCKGFGDSTGFFDFGGVCMRSRIGIVFLFFIVAMVRKWGAEEVGLEFNFLFSLIGGMLLYLVLITLFGSYKIAFVGGLGAALLLGYGSGYFFGGDGE